MMSNSIKFKNINDTFKKLAGTLQTREEKNLINNSERLRQELSDVTPVDTGLAAASWRSFIKQIVGSRTVVIENTVPYIEYLNAGSSKQAPKYFVERTALKYGKAVGTIVVVK